MIWYIVSDSEANYRSSSDFYRTKFTLERFSGDICLVIHYSQVSMELLHKYSPWAICHSGGSALYSEYDVLENDTYKTLVTEAMVPQIGFCGGHQIISAFFGSEIGPMRQLEENEPDHCPEYQPGMFKEWGVYPVRIVKRDPVFEGLPNAIRVFEYHFWEVKKLSDELVLLASSDNCKVQAFVHKTKPIYGTQFHPEASNEAYPDGFKILQNFFNIARNFESQRSS